MGKWFKAPAGVWVRRVLVAVIYTVSLVAWVSLLYKVFSENQ